MMKFRMVSCLIAVIWSSAAVAQDGIKLVHSVQEMYGKTCITQLAHNKCKAGYQAVEVALESMAMVCLPSGTDTTNQLVVRAQSGEVTELQGYPAALFSNITVANICAPVQVMALASYESVPYQQIEERVFIVLKLFDGINIELLTLDSHFIDDHGLTELDIVEIIGLTEDEFGVELNEDPLVYTPRELIELVDSTING